MLNGFRGRYRQELYDNRRPKLEDNKKAQIQLPKRPNKSNKCHVPAELLMLGLLK